jgi:UDP-N-acetylglucosamine 2-epimerase (non-hydrolysing)
MRNARMVLTDSGGVQEETTALDVPCLTLRTSTERPITIEEGTNTLVGTDRRVLLEAVDDIMAIGGKRGRAPEYWDGRAAERIAVHLASWLRERAYACAAVNVAVANQGSATAQSPVDLASR